VIKAVLFDFDGVLVDDEPVHCEVLLRVLREEGIELSEKEYFRHYLGRDDPSCFVAAFAAAGRSIGETGVMRLVARKGAYFRERIREEGHRVLPGALDLVKDLRRAGAMLGVVTGAQREEVEAGLAAAGLWESFKVIVTASDVKEGKPAPDGYLLALQQLNSMAPLPPSLIHPHQALSIEDSPAGIAAARSADLLTLGVEHRYRGRELVDADVVVESLAGLDLARLQSLFAEVSRR